MHHACTRKRRRFILATVSDKGCNGEQADPRTCRVMEVCRACAGMLLSVMVTQ
jgi:hypothetical protein